MSTAEPGTDTLENLREALRSFAAERDWERFHTPKNLAMALAGEAGEVLEVLQWLTPEESATLKPADKEALARELADVMLYLVRLADVCDIDLAAACASKLEINANRYPVAKALGRATKYDRL